MTEKSEKELLSDILRVLGEQKSLFVLAKSRKPFKDEERVT